MLPLRVECEPRIGFVEMSYFTDAYVKLKFLSWVPDHQYISMYLAMVNHLVTIATHIGTTNHSVVIHTYILTL